MSAIVQTGKYCVGHIVYMGIKKNIKSQTEVTRLNCVVSVITDSLYQVVTHTHTYIYVYMATIEFLFRD